MSRLSAKNLTFSYDPEENKIIQDFSLEFPKEGIVGILGPNGCGKSTLMALLAGVFQPESGEVVIEGKKTTEYNSEEEINDKVTFIFQNMEFETDEKVIDLMHLIAERNKQTEHYDIDIIIDRLKIKNITKKSIQKISKGELQKVIICFALLSNPSIILLDEPIFALSREDSINALELIREHATTYKKLVLLSLHDIDLMERFCDHAVIFLKKGGYEFGSSQKLLTKEHLEAVFGVPYSLLKQPASVGTSIEKLLKKAGH